MAPTVRVFGIAQISQHPKKGGSSLLAQTAAPFSAMHGPSRGLGILLEAGKFIEARHFVEGSSASRTRRRWRVWFGARVGKVGSSGR
jgi:hypothetical protein